MRRALALAALMLTIAAATGCGAKPEPGDGASSGKREDLRLVLDYFPNADHAGLYAAQASGEYDRAGLEVDIKAPPDPAAPIKLLRSLDASRWQTLRMLELPSALPATFTGVKIAAAVAVIGAVFAEWAGSDRGLGHTLLIANGQLETARAFAATVLLFALAVALYGLFALLERKVVSWTPRSEAP